MRPGAISAAAFEALYSQSPDPWEFATSAYEQGRYRATLAALGRSSYDRAFEPGCSVGVLTEALARRCRRVLATDFSASAVSRARLRCRHLDNVEIARADLALGVPEGLFDLIVFSEIGYYFSVEMLCTLASSLAGSLVRDGEFLATHWLGSSPDHVLHGDTVHEVLRTCLPCDWVSGARHEGFRIDRWRAR